MNERQTLRQTMAENGLEKTPGEIDELVDVFCPSFHMYEKFLSMTDKDIRTMANECGNTYEFAKEVVDISLYMGHLKWGT